MPPELERLQLDFRDNALAEIATSGDEPRPAARLVAAIVPAGVPAARRLAIHRNHYAVTLVDALAGVFGATRNLVGPAYFDAFALRFARAHPPGNPCLFEYGAGLPDALRDGPGMAAHGYVAEVASLEWAMHASFHAPAADALRPARLAAVAPDAVAAARLRLHATVRLIRADFAVDRLWRAALAGDAAMDALQAEPTALLLRRPGFDVTMDVVSAGVHGLLQAIAAGAALGDAAAAALDADAAFDLGEALGACLGWGVFADAID